jgi:hypothetical protein
MGGYLAGARSLGEAYRRNVKNKSKISEINDRLGKLADIMARDGIPGAWRQYRSDAGRNAAREYDALMTERQNVLDDPGQLYEVNIPEDEDLLDWDKPLSEQPEKVKKKIKQIYKDLWHETYRDDKGFIITTEGEEGEFETREEAMEDAAERVKNMKEYGYEEAYVVEEDGDIIIIGDDDHILIYSTRSMPGQDFYRDIAYELAGSSEDSEKKASLFLKEYGIPGLRYLDGQSRNRGEGSHNYVIFDENLINVLETYYQNRESNPSDRLSTAQGLFDGQTVHLVAGNLSPDEAAGTLLHEFWHKALKAMNLAGDPAYAKLRNRLRFIERAAKNGETGAWFRRAYARIPEADRNDPEKRFNELAAYAITEYENAPRSLPQAIAKWVQDFLAAVRAFLFQKTGTLPKNLTAADLSAIARQFLREEAKRADRAEGRAQPLSSRVLTPSGYRLMSDIRVGDEVIAGDGSITAVEAVFPQGVKPIYRITLSDGSAARSTGDHLWKVREEGTAGYEVLPLEAVMQGFAAGKRYEIPGFGARV